MTSFLEHSGRSPEKRKPLRLQQSVEQPACPVLLTLPPAFAGREAPRRAQAAIRSVVAALPDDARLVIAAHRPIIEAARGWQEIAKRDTRWIELDAGLDHTLWAQDEFLAGWEGEKPVLLLPSPAKRPVDRLVVEAVAAGLGVSKRDAGFAFEGGNVLVGERTVLVGADSAPRLGDAELEARLAPFTSGRRVKVVRSMPPLPAREVRFRSDAAGFSVEELFGHTGTFQPLFHIDAFLTLAGSGPDGRERLFVGCARTAARLAARKRLTPEEELVALALDEVAADLEGDDAFQVVRNPLSLVPFAEAGLFAWSPATVAKRFAGALGLDDVLAEMRRRNLRSVAVHRWRAATQNGCVVFRGEAEKRVLLPTFAYGPHAALRPAEAENRRQWEAHGFGVTELADFAPVAAANGSLHCLVKFLPAECRPAGPA